MLVHTPGSFPHRLVAALVAILMATGMVATSAHASRAAHATPRPIAQRAIATVESPEPVALPAASSPSPVPHRAVPAPAVSHVSVGAVRAVRAAPQRAYPRVAVPRLGIDLPLIEGNGGAPPKYVAAHLPGTAPPGQAGNSYLYAHDLAGMFLNLHHAAVGDQVLLELAPDTTIAYQVSEIHPLVDQTDFTYAQPTPDDRLTLQTCNWPQNQNKRFIVVAQKVG